MVGDHDGKSARQCCDHYDQRQHEPAALHRFGLLDLFPDGVDVSLRVTYDPFIMSPGCVRWMIYGGCHMPSLEELGWSIRILMLHLSASRIHEPFGVRGGVFENPLNL